MQNFKKASIDLVLPAHNEAASIGITLSELYTHLHDELSLKIRFVVSEDGSRDETLAVLERLSGSLPIKIVTAPHRKGYSRAVIDGLRETEADFIAFIDSDGQYNPKDFSRFLKEIENHDLVIGYRAPRSDHWTRILFSRLFKIPFNIIFSVPLRDPSCSFLLMKRKALMKVVGSPSIGILKQGFWWEFTARARSLGVSMKEIPVEHLQRSYGKTQVYLPAQMPKIAWQHFIGLFKLRRAL